MVQKTNNLGQTEEEFLNNYDSSIYEKPSITVDMLIFTIDEEENYNYRKLNNKELKVLLIERADHPFINQWALPGGFVGIDESIDIAANRKLLEETNVQDVYLEQLYTFGDINRDPRMRVVSTAYMALVDKERLNIKAGDDAANAKWFSVKYDIVDDNIEDIENGYIHKKTITLQLKHNDIVLNAMIKNEIIVKNKIKTFNSKIIQSEGIAFDHAKIILSAIERLRNKIMYTDIAFNLMPEYFTIKELEQVYEIILNKKLLNFRRTIKDMIIETDKVKENAGHRPAKLYKFNYKHSLLES